MKKNWIIIMAILALAGCKKGNSDESDNEESNKEIGSNASYVLSGSLQNATEGSVILNQLVGGNVIRKDSVGIASDGTFEFKGEVPVADFYQLMINNGPFTVFVLDNKDLKFSADLNNFEATKKMEGSYDTEVLDLITKEVTQRNLERNAFNQRFVEARGAGNQDQMDAITKEFETTERQSIERIKRIIAANTTSFIAAVGALNFLNPEQDFEFMDSISNVMNSTLPDSRYTQQLFTKVKSMRTLRVGSMAPEINLPNPDGNLTSLRSLRGKYVLIDFWASWCKPCRMENPNVVQMYAKYKGPKFEIFGVSLDKDNGRWKKAIDQDGITWTQVSDLKAWGSSAAASYEVRSIPATFLIDPDGKIIAKNLRGRALEEKMKEIFG